MWILEHWRSTKIYRPQFCWHDPITVVDRSLLKISWFSIATKSRTYKHVRPKSIPRRDEVINAAASTISICTRHATTFCRRNVWITWPPSSAVRSGCVNCSCRKHVKLDGRYHSARGTPDSESHLLDSSVRLHSAIIASTSFPNNSDWSVDVATSAAWLVNGRFNGVLIMREALRQ